MIKLFIYSLLAIVVGLVLSMYSGFPGDPGYLLIAFGDYTFETSLFALLAAAALLTVLVRAILLVFYWINPWHLVRYGRNYSRQRKAKARSKSTEGLLYFIRGNWQSSYSLLTKSTNDDDATVVNYLIAAYAAYEMGDRESWMQWLQKAEEDYPSARSTVNSLKAQLLFKSDQLEQCLAVLEQLKKSSLNDATLLQLLKKVYVKLEDWEKLGALLPTLEKLKIIDKAEVEQIQKRVFVEELTASPADDSPEGSRVEPVARLFKLWKKAPSRYRSDEKVVKHYTKLLIKFGEKEEASKVMEAALSRNWNDAMVLRYGEQDLGTNPQQLIHAEGWLKARPANATLFLSLGRICMRNQLWGKAKDYYRASIKMSPSAEAYGELGRLLKHLGEVEAGEESLKNYGDLIGADLPELPLPSPTKVTH